MASKRKAKFKVGQVVYIRYARTYSRIRRINKNSVAVGSSCIALPFDELRPLTAREKGGKET